MRTRKRVEDNHFIRIILICTYILLLVLISVICIHADENVNTEMQMTEMFVNDLHGDETELAPSISGYSLRSGEVLSVAVWSEDGGQDDLRWYQLSQTGDNLYSATIRPADYHRTSGEYEFHFYSSYNGILTFIGQCAHNVSPVTCNDITVLSRDDVNGTAHISINGISCPSGIKSVSAAIWSRDDQSDILWYEAILGSDGSYYVDMNIANHKWNIGKYQVHVYATNGNGISNFVDSTTIDFSIQQGYVAAEKDAYGKTYILTASGFSVQGTAAGYVFAVWSEKNGQDDLTWTSAEYNQDSGIMSCSYSVDKLKNYGTVYIDAYVSHSNGNMYFVGRTISEIYGNYCDSIYVSEQNDASGTCKLVISGLTTPEGLKGVTVPVWTINNGQDDLTWYNAEKQNNGDYTVTIDARNHKYETGDYVAHVYVINASGRYDFIGAQGITFDETRPEIIVTKFGSTYVLKVSNLLSAGNISGASIACWTDTGGQDDLTWVSATYDSASKAVTAALDAGKLKHSGIVNAHLYVTNKNGFEFVEAFTFDSDNVEEENPICVESNNETGSFNVTINGAVINQQIRSVVVPIWSKPDQSDIVWYTAQKNEAGDYVVNADIANHKYNLGTYNIHVYTVDNKMTFLDSATTEFKTQYSSIATTAKDSRYYSADINGLVIPGGVKSVSFAVWSEQGGQDDLYWYEASNDVNGHYTAAIDLNKHKTEGRYFVHVYGRTNSGANVFIGSTDDMNVEDYTFTAMSVDNVNTKKGTFDVHINVDDSKTLLGIVVPIWSKYDQSDIKWYNAVKQSVDTYLVSADIRNHGNNSGIYNIHAYAKYSDGSMVFLDALQQHVTTEDALIVSNADGSSSRRITFNEQGVSKVSFAVWTVTNGQDDLRWYDAENDGNGMFHANVSASNHKHNGEYIVHVYADGECVTGKTFYIIDYVEWAIRTANDDSVGYSQANRKMNPDVDCSSFVFYSVYYNGFASKLGTSSPFSTLSEVNLLQRCGFTVMTYENMDSLKPGDILWYRRNGAGHTEIYIGNGMMVGAHDSVVNGVDYPEGGDQTGQEVSVKAFSNPSWMMVLRYY